MTPIHTTYADVTFRSRLEARWAVFFDKLGVRWLYEPEGFELPSGARYLPDFYLPDRKLWVEVKPKFVDDKRWAEFRDQIDPDEYGHSPFQILVGPPSASGLESIPFTVLFLPALFNTYDPSKILLAAVADAINAANAHRFW